MTTLIITAKKQLKTRSHFDILHVYQYSKLGWEVLNVRNNHKHLIRFDMKLATLTCTCVYGTQEISSGAIDELHRCKHIEATRQFIAREKK